MPFYEYQCDRCGHHLEAMQKVHDSPLKKCPECGKSALRRLISAPVFRLKGGGWYETDFKAEGEGKRNLADQPAVDAAKDDKKDAKEAKDAKDAKEAVPKEAVAAKEEKQPAAKAAEPAARKSTAKFAKRGGAVRAAAPKPKKAIKKAAARP
jgi:putative FmdB family regulatory protein